VLGGSAVFESAAVLLDKIRAAAAVRLGCEPAEIEITEDYAGTRNGRSVALAELAEDGLKADASFANHHRHTYAYGTAAAPMSQSIRERGEWSSLTISLSRMLGELLIR
jgi:CO/xanthine dehydrogenase Mo-binding subunit